MRAFIDGRVSKARLLNSLREHARMDRVIQGYYWLIKGWDPAWPRGGGVSVGGCFMGCCLHDFSPGFESSKREYERVFGIPQNLVFEAESVFEGLPISEAKSFPVRLIEAIPEGAEGADLEEAIRVSCKKRTSHRPSWPPGCPCESCWVERGEFLIEAVMKLDPGSGLKTDAEAPQKERT